MIRQIPFAGNEENSPMIWGIEQELDNMRWRILESYDNGLTWIVNCYLKTEADCDAFIAAWMQEYNY